MSGITGYSYPKFDIYTGNTFVEQISLDLCGVNGLTEEYEPYGIRHDLIDYSSIISWKGFHIYFTLSYSEYSNNTHSLKIQKLINYIINNYRIIMIPRSDLMYRYYEVIYNGDTMSLSIMKGGISAKGNKGIELKFRTKYLQNDMKWLDTETIGITKEDFAISA